MSGEDGLTRILQLAAASESNLYLKDETVSKISSLRQRDEYLGKRMNHTHGHDSV